VKWDLESTHSLEAFAEWARKQADAATVIIVRGQDYAFAAAPGIRPGDAIESVQSVLPGAQELAEYRLRVMHDKELRRRAERIVRGDL
jgi:hypothetical protein